MTEQQYEAIVGFFARKVRVLERNEMVDEGQPYVLALAALTKDYPGVSRTDVVQSVRVLMLQYSAQALEVYEALGLEEAGEDAIHCSTIALVLEMAAHVAEASVAEEEAA